MRTADSKAKYQTQADFEPRTSTYTRSAQHNQNNYDAQSNRSQAENMAKKKGFTFIQKAGLAGAGITALLFFVKSKILTFLSFLTAIPTAGLLYFGFRKSFSDTTKPSPKEPVEEKRPDQSKETLDTISKLNQIKDSSKNPLVKEFIHNVSQTLAATDSFDAKEIAQQLIEVMDYQVDKQTIKKIQTDLHPDKHTKASDDEKGIYKKLFSVIGEYKNIQN